MEGKRDASKLLVLSQNASHCSSAPAVRRPQGRTRALPRCWEEWGGQVVQVQHQGEVSHQPQPPLYHMGQPRDGKSIFFILPPWEKSKEEGSAWKHPLHEIIFWFRHSLKLISASLILLTVHRDNLNVRSRNAGPGWQPRLGLWLAFQEIVPVRTELELHFFFLSSWRHQDSYTCCQTLSKQR